MTVFLFLLTQKRVMTSFNDNVLGLMRVMCGTRVTLLSFGTKEYSKFDTSKHLVEFWGYLHSPWGTQTSARTGTDFKGFGKLSEET